MVSYGRLPTYSFVLMNYSCISTDALNLITGSSGMLGDETQERRENSDLMRKAVSAAAEECSKNTIHRKPCVIARSLQETRCLLNRRDDDIGCR